LSSGSSSSIWRALRWIRVVAGWGGGRVGGLTVDRGQQLGVWGEGGKGWDLVSASQTVQASPCCRPETCCCPTSARPHTEAVRQAVTRIGSAVLLHSIIPCKRATEQHTHTHTHITCPPRLSACCSWCWCTGRPGTPSPTRRPG
jgi:hypothetical protein